MNSPEISTVDPADMEEIVAWNATMRTAYSSGRAVVWWTSAEASAEQLRAARAGHLHMALTARRGGMMVGGAEIALAPGQPAEVEIGVLREHRGQGIGTALAAAARELCGDHEPPLLQTEVFTEEGVTFARSWEIEPGNVEHRQVLDLPLSAEALDALDRPSPHLTTRSWVGACPEDLVDSLARLTEQMEEDVPAGSLTRIVTPTDRERIRRNEVRLDAEGYDLVRSIAQHAGKSIGYTSLFVPRADPEIVVQDYTLVDRAYRGQGVGRALKIANLRQLAAVPSAAGSRWVQTSTAVTNAPMLDLNVAIGFRTVDSIYECEGRVDSLPAASHPS
ncbi:GNAT family N-acetyltransferase [Brachybacterium sp. 107]|uniref:GNAT family N-acetyltransferase n=1 Tax=Brachybacterium sp. 107 TaxID=3457736 RepID=UPI0040338B21